MWGSITTPTSLPIPIIPTITVPGRKPWCWSHIKAVEVCTTGGFGVQKMTLNLIEQTKPWGTIRYNHINSLSDASWRDWRLHTWYLSSTSLWCIVMSCMVFSTPHPPNTLAVVQRCRLFCAIVLAAIDTCAQFGPSFQIDVLVLPILVSRHGWLYHVTLFDVQETQWQSRPGMPRPQNLICIKFCVVCLVHQPGWNHPTLNVDEHWPEQCFGR